MQRIIFKMILWNLEMSHVDAIHLYSSIWRKWKIQEEQQTSSFWTQCALCAHRWKVVLTYQEINHDTQIWNPINWVCQNERTITRWALYARRERSSLFCQNQQQSGSDDGWCKPVWLSQIHLVLRVMPICILIQRQISAWQSATLLPISCKSVQPVPVRVEEHVSPVR